MSKNTDLIDKIYDAEAFRALGHKLVDVLADHLNDCYDGSIDKAIPYMSPETMYEFWSKDLNTGIEEDASHMFKEIMSRSVKLHHPAYMGHQVGVVAPITALAAMVSSLLNNGMALYEMGQVSTALEKIVVDIMASQLGFSSDSGGFLTSGGTLANLTALLAARARHTNVWTEGSTQKLAIMVSEEAHYCVDRAARIMGLGDEGIIKIPCNNQLEMQTSLLGQYLENAKAKGLYVFAVVASSCSTSSGSYDDIGTISEFAKANNIWLHVDGAHGGAVAFSNKYSHLIQGISEADSVIIDWHKMLMLPALVTSVVFKNNNDAYQTFHQKAQYLWSNQSSQDWYNLGKRTFECTKLMMSIKIYSIIKSYGIEAFEAYVDKCYDLGATFAHMINKRPDYQLATEPKSNIVCFRKYDATKSDDELNHINENIRARLLEDGSYYVVQTTIRGIFYLRVTLMNPLTGDKELSGLLNHIDAIDFHKG